MIEYLVKGNAVLEAKVEHVSLASISIQQRNQNIEVWTNLSKASINIRVDNRRKRNASNTHFNSHSFIEWS